MLALWLVALCAPAPAHARNLALLVGVAAYDEPAIRSLEGPRNDVLLLWRHLTKHGFAAEDVTVLAEGLPERADTPRPAAAPTRAAILAAFADLATKAGPGDLALIHFSGHGSTQPEGAVDEGAEPEPGGRVQVLLPKDAGKYDADARTIRNAIVDKEIGPPLHRLRDKGARVFIIVDACHAGAVTRAGSTDVARAVDGAALGAPEIVAPSPTIKPAARRAAIKAQNRGALVGFFAVDSWNEALERPMPASDAFIGADGARKFGVFTWRLVRALEQGRARSYRELARLTALDIARNGAAAAPPPMFEGDLDAALPGVATSGPARFAGRVESGALTLDAGMLHGFETGARVALFDAPVAAARKLGVVTLDEASAATSRAGFASAAGQVWAELEAPAVAFRLRIAAAASARALVAAAAEGLPIDLVEGPADLVATLADGRVWLTRDGPAPVGGAGPRARSPSAPAQGAPDARAELRALLWRFARAANLVRLAAASAAPDGDAGSVRITLDLTRETEKTALADARRNCAAVRKPADERLPSETGAVLGHCDGLRLSIENGGERDLDVGVFFLNPDATVATPSRDWRQNGCIAFLPAKAQRPLGVRTQMRLWTANGPGHSGLHRILVFALPRQGGLPANLCPLVEGEPPPGAQAALRAASPRGFAGLLARAGMADPTLRTANPFAEEEMAEQAGVTVKQFAIDLRPAGF